MNDGYNKTGLCGMPPASPQTLSQLQQAISSLCSLNGAFDDSLKYLEERLGPILRDQFPSEGNEKDCALPQLVPAADQIRNMTIKLTQYLNRIKNISDRVEA